MSTKCKTNAPAGTGKARAGRGRARTHEGHAQGKARHAQARARYAHTTGFLSTCWFVLQDKQHRKARATRSKARTHRGYGQNQGLNCLKIKSSTWFAMDGLGPLTSPARVSLPRVFFEGDVSLRTSPPPPLEWFPFPPLVAAVSITSKGAESPGSGRIGVIGALVFFPI